MNNITVFCSNYNSSQFIDGYLKCLNRQTLPQFDIIIVDALSSDDSCNKIKFYQFREGIHYQLIELPVKVGIYEAWNEAIKLAKTPYVINLNTDDRLYPYALELYSRYIHNYPDIDLFYGPCDIVQDVKHQQIVGRRNWPPYSHQQLLHLCICGPFPLVRRQAIVDTGYFDTKFHASGDYDMWLKLSFNGYKFYRIPESVGSYYLNPQGLSTESENLKLAQKHDIEIQARYKK